MPVVARSPSPPSLESLFDTPPRDLGPKKLLHVIVPDHPTRITESRASSAAPRFWTTLDKGKARTSGERPADLSNPSAYFPQLRYTRNGVTVRFCKPCSAAGGDRAAKAAYCRGRHTPNQCTFEAVKEIASDEETGSPESDALRSEGDDESISGASTSFPAASPQAKPSSDTEITEPWKEDSRYIQSLVFVPSTTKPRRCGRCRAAGGKWAERAPWCRGRVWVKWCSFLDDRLDVLPKTGSDQLSAKPQQGLRRASGDGTTPNGHHSETPSDPRTPAVEERSLTPEPVFLSSDSSRARRRRIVLTPPPTSPEHETDQPLASPPVTGSAVARPSAKRSVISLQAGTSKARRPSRWGPTGPAPQSSPRSSAVFPSPSPTLNSGSPEAPLHRRHYTARLRSSTDIAPPSPPRSSSMMRTSPGLESIHIELPNPGVGRKNQLRPVFDIAAPSPPRSSSITNMSPAVEDRVPLEHVTSRAPPVTSRPTPSPSFSAPRIASSPSLWSSMPPSSPPFARRSLPSRLASPPFRPTPPPSTNGARSSSEFSDNLPLHLPQRRSALRRPSEGSITTPHSVKKARFSLQPRSPPPEPSSGPITEDDDDDELLLRNTSSPVSTLSRSSPVYGSDCASHFSREMSVRAADVGFKLGPEPTGRLSCDMLAALAPSLSSAHPTLGASIFQRDPTPTYALSTPPLSFCSTMSPSTRSRTASSPSKPTAGLMLPPPVPVKRLESARLTTPVEDNKPFSEIKFTTQSPALLRARSRSRSVSTAPTSRRQSVAPLPSTTPRRKSRLERDLARVARVAGDEAGLEWGMDEEVGDDVGRMWREGSVARYLD